MLLWETILSTRYAGRPVRLPGDNRCAALTKTGRRCKGRTRNGSQYCIFHDPSLDLGARRRAARTRPRARKRTQYHMNGVASRLTTRRGINAALDRLYNDTRAGLIPPEAGQVLFNMLERLWDAYSKNRAAGTASGEDRSRAARLCRKLAKNYISLVEKHRGGGPGLTASNSPKEARPSTRPAAGSKLKLPPFEPSPPATTPWPANLARREA